MFDENPLISCKPRSCIFKRFRMSMIFLSMIYTAYSKLQNTTWREKKTLDLRSENMYYITHLTSALREFVSNKASISFRSISFLRRTSAPASKFSHGALGRVRFSLFTLKLRKLQKAMKMKQKVSTIREVALVRRKILRYQRLTSPRSRPAWKETSLSKCSTLFCSRIRHRCLCSLVLNTQVKYHGRR